MFTGLEGLVGRVLLERLIRSLGTRMQNMLQILSNFWKEQISVSQLKFEIWLHVEEVEWAAGLGVGVLALLLDLVIALVDVMEEVVVDDMIQTMVEGMEGEAEAVVLIVTVTGMGVVGNMMQMLRGDITSRASMKPWLMLERSVAEAEVEAPTRVQDGVIFVVEIEAVAVAQTGLTRPHQLVIAHLRAVFTKQ